MRTKKEQERRRSRSRNARQLAQLQVPADRPGFDEIAAEMARFAEEGIRRQDAPLYGDLPHPSTGVLALSVARPAALAHVASPREAKPAIADRWYLGEMEGAE